MLRILHFCLLSWSTDPTKPLSIPVILHDIFLKTGIPRVCLLGGTVSLLCHNLTDGCNYTSRYPDPHATTILTQCTYLLSRLARHTKHQLPNLRISFSHTTPLLIDTHMHLVHQSWLLGTSPNFTLAYTKGQYCPSFTHTTNNLHFLLLELPHVHTSETTVDPNPRLTVISDFTGHTYIMICMH